MNKFGALLIKALDHFSLLDPMDDVSFLKLVYEAKVGKKLELENPQLFTEKMQWLKLYDRKPEYSKLVDKYEVKQIVEKLIGKQHIIPTIGVWQNANDIDFSILPTRYVLKCTHNSAGIVIVKDNTLINRRQVVKKLNRSLKRNFYLSGREWPYKDVPPRIIAEEYLEDPDTHDLRDYKFFCFNGKVKCFKVDLDRFTMHRANYYDRDMNLLPFGEALYPPNKDANIQFPNNLKEMINLAEILAAGSIFRRVDLYNVNGNIYFGEITFFPDSGFGRFTPPEWDKELGEWLTINSINMSS